MYRYTDSSERLLDMPATLLLPEARPLLEHGTDWWMCGFGNDLGLPILPSAVKRKSPVLPRAAFPDHVSTAGNFDGVVRCGEPSADLPAMLDSMKTLWQRYGRMVRARESARLSGGTLSVAMGTRM